MFVLFGVKHVILSVKDRNIKISKVCRLGGRQRKMGQRKEIDSNSRKNSFE
jgi:hypothetical protein